MIKISCKRMDYKKANISARRVWMRDEGRFLVKSNNDERIPKRWLEGKKKIGC